MDVIRYMLLAILGTLSWPAAHEKAECLVFHDQPALVRAWAKDGGAVGQGPHVDWNKEMVVAVFGGRKATGGYSVHVRTVAVPATEQKVFDLYVIYDETAPRADEMTTQAITYPCEVVRLRAMRVGPVHCLRSDTPQARQILSHLQ